MNQAAAPGAICNVCSAQLAPLTGDEETPHCPRCRSNRRIRALIALLSRELFGVAIAAPDFPPMKSVRGLGITDWPEVAEPLAAKFDYVNTFYDRPPRFDITNPGDDRGQSGQRFAGCRFLAGAARL